MNPRTRLLRRVEPMGVRAPPAGALTRTGDGGSGALVARAQAQRQDGAARGGQTRGRGRECGVRVVALAQRASGRDVLDRAVADRVALAGTRTIERGPEVISWCFE